MADLIGTAVWKDKIRKLETTDPGHADTFNVEYQDLINNDVYLKGEVDSVKNEVVAARAGKPTLNDRLLALESQTLQGESTFNSTSGRTITHSLGHTNYIVNIRPLEDTKGDLGDVWISKASNAFTVYNTGGFVGAFRYQIMT